MKLEASSSRTKVTAVRGLDCPFSHASFRVSAPFNPPTSSTHTEQMALSSRLQQFLIAENLGLAGFEQIGSSPFYRKGHFLINIETSAPVLYVPFDWVADCDEIVGVRGLTERGGPGLTIISRDSRGYAQSSFSKHGNACSFDVRWTIDHILSTPPETQLAEAGFTQYGKYQNLYRLKEPEFTESRERIPELIAIIDRGKIAAIARAVSPGVQDKITENTRIISGPEAERFIRPPKETEPVITLTNDRMQFQVSLGGHIIEGSQCLFQEISLNELGIKAPGQRRERSGFVIGGRNSTQIIARLKSINNIAIRDLETIMRPGKTSKAGFLNKSQSLLEVLATDNDYVLGQGLTHQGLAKHLRYAMAIHDQGYACAFPYQGNKFRIDCERSKGIQISPFEDGTNTESVYLLTNLKTGKAIRFSGLLPAMIERYGFYEGNSRYRLEPKDVIEVFELLKK